MARKKGYDADAIQVLSDQEHVRKRTQIYLGNMHETSYTVPLFVDNKFTTQDITFVPAVYKAIGEIIDNSLDEFAQTSLAGKRLTIEADPILGMYTIGDNGRGVPIARHETGPHTPEVVFNQLRSGRNFGDEKDAGVIGQNGVGSACVNFCSTEFMVDIYRDGKHYKQKFSDGGSKVNKPSIRKATTVKSGTSVYFQLDSEIFKDIALPADLMRNRAIEIALTNPGVTVEYNNKRYKYRSGFVDVVKKISKDYFHFKDGDIEFFVIFDVNTEVDEQIFTWVNSSLLFDGGICNTQFLNAFYSKVTGHLQSRAKKLKCEVSKNDVRNSLLVLGNLRVSDPQYDAQSKTRLTGPNLRKDMDQLIENQWASFVRKNKDWFETVLERAQHRHHKTADKSAVTEHKKNLSRKIPKLIDATNRDRRACQLLITEGDSASSKITQARDPKIHAAISLSGKINNVYGITVAQLLKMGKVADLITAIGLVPGQRALRSELNYGKVIIATDADVDGGDIFALLVNLFYAFWPELFDSAYEPFFHRLIAPNVCAVKGKKRIHFPTRREYEKVKNRYKGYNIVYYKGLGSMVQEDWEMILSGKTDTMIPIVDDGHMKGTLKLLFGPDADMRKEWLQA